MNGNMEENPYLDIIHLPRPQSKKHAAMPLLNRAAQFAPFSALVGHGDAIKETMRQYEQRVEMGEDEYVPELIGVHDDGIL